MAKDTKERILDEALRQFSQKGYDGTNIRELTASLGLVEMTMQMVYLTVRDERASQLAAKPFCE